MKERESNFEALRIVAMCMVVLLHLDGASLGLPAPAGPFAADARDWWRLVVEAGAIVGVNCFTMISGYFGIRLSWRSMIRFVGLCLFYSVGVISVVMLINGTWQWTRWGESWMVLTHNDLWYVPAYFGLCLLAPLLNAGLDTLSRRQLSLTLIAFIAFNCYCGWWHGGKFNPTGYTIIQLVMMYLIGGYLRRHVDFKRNVAQCRQWSIAMYVWTTMAVVFMSLYCKSTFTFAYNSPLVIAQSVALFAFFATLRFHCKVINYLASGAFAVYLIHKNPAIWVEYLRPAVRNVWAHTTLLEFTIFTIVATACIYLFGFIIDRIRQLIVAFISHRHEK